MSLKATNATARIALMALVLGSCLVGTSCIMPDDVAQMQKDLADVRQQLRVAQQSQRASEQKLAALESREQGDDDRVTRSDLAELMVQVQQASRDSAVAAERVNELDRRFERLSQDVRQSNNRPRLPSSTPTVAPPSVLGTDGDGIPGTDPVRAGSDATPDPDSLFNTAYADFSKGNYALAISGFAEYQERFPDSAQADNALYWIGECHFSQGSFGEVIRSFDDLLARYPESDKAAAANLKKALAYLEQNQIGQAIIQLRFVRTSFPGSDEAKVARDKLHSLGAEI